MEQLGHSARARTSDTGDRSRSRAVEEQDHLLLPGQGAPHASRRAPHSRGRRRRRGRAARSEDRPPPPAGGVAHRCGRAASARRCGDAPPGGASRARAWHCRVSGGHPPGGPDRADVAGVIAGRRSLLVAPLMLLVDHDGAQTLDGREDPERGPDRTRRPRDGAPATRRPVRLPRVLNGGPPPGRRTRRAPAPPSAASARSRERARWRPVPRTRRDGAPRGRRGSFPIPSRPWISDGGSGRRSQNRVHDGPLAGVSSGGGERRDPRRGSRASVTRWIRAQPPLTSPSSAAREKPICSTRCRTGAEPPSASTASYAPASWRPRERLLPLQETRRRRSR